MRVHAGKRYFTSTCGLKQGAVWAKRRPICYCPATRGPFAWKDRPDFSCFQAQNETVQITRGARAELGSLADTQAKPEVGPFAPKAK